MTIKLEKAYRHRYSFCNDYLDAYKCLVKVKREKPEYYPWEGWQTCGIHIHYESMMPDGKQWILSPGFGSMDKEFERLNVQEYHSTRASLIKEIKRIIPEIGFEYGTFEFA